MRFVRRRLAEILVFVLAVVILYAGTSLMLGRFAREVMIVVAGMTPIVALLCFCVVPGLIVLGGVVDAVRERWGGAPAAACVVIATLAMAGTAVVAAPGVNMLQIGVILALGAAIGVGVAQLRWRPASTPALLVTAEEREAIRQPAMLLLLALVPLGTLLTGGGTLVVIAAAVAAGTLGATIAHGQLPNSGAMGCTFLIVVLIGVPMGLMVAVIALPAAFVWLSISQAGWWYTAPEHRWRWLIADAGVAMLGGAVMAVFYGVPDVSNMDVAITSLAWMSGLILGGAMPGLVAGGGHLLVLPEVERRLVERLRASPSTTEALAPAARH